MIRRSVTLSSLFEWFSSTSDETFSFSADSLLAGNVVPGMFNCLVLNAAGLVAGGVDGVLRSVQIENNGIKIAEVLIYFLSSSENVNCEAQVR